VSHARIARPLAALLVAGALLGASCRPAGDTAPAPQATPGPARSVTGYATEIEFGDMSLRTVDGRSLIFDIRDAPLGVAELEQLMAERRALRVTYAARRTALVPVGIEVLCPGPECPPPYTQPTPSLAGVRAP
jgi:hypothetical protein